MKNARYPSLLVIYPKEFEEELEPFLLFSGTIGSELMDPESLRQAKQTGPEWALYDAAELHRAQEAELGRTLKEGMAAQRLFFDSNREGRAQMNQLLQRLQGPFQGRLEIIEEAPVDNSHWNEQWRSFYRPILIDDQLRILPSWEAVPEDGLRTIRIEPGMAFGTGTHETTSLCLRLLLQQNLVDCRLLDLGTGSGILSIFAKMAGAASVMATDIDEDALKTARANAALNGQQEIDFRHSDLMEEVEGDFDFIVANLLLPLVKRLLPALPERLKAGGRLLLSGLLVNQLEEVQRLAKSVGLSETARLTDGEWGALLFKESVHS